MWVRGLKRLLMLNHGILTESHPMWVRGLKHLTHAIMYLMSSRTPCGCVD